MDFTRFRANDLRKYAYIHVRVFPYFMFYIEPNLRKMYFLAYICCQKFAQMNKFVYLCTLFVSQTDKKATSINTIQYNIFKV